MATDRDRYARVLDKRFERIAYALRVKDPLAVTKLCEYVEMREREADKDLAALFRSADRVLKRGAPLLFEGHDPEAEWVRRRGLASHAATRMGYAFDDALREGRDLSDTLAERRVRWIAGCLNTQQDWRDTVDALEHLRHHFSSELSRRQRYTYLGIGDAPVRTPRKSANQSEIANQQIPVTSAL